MKQKKNPKKINETVLNMTQKFKYLIFFFLVVCDRFEGSSFGKDLKKGENIVP